MLTSLLSFNVGVELGQLFVLVFAVPILALLFRKWLPELVGVIALSAFLAHTGWHWFLDRGGDLLQYDFTVPVMNAALTATLLRWIMLALIIVGALWGLRGLHRWVGEHFGGGSAETPPVNTP